MAYVSRLRILPGGNYAFWIAAPRRQWKDVEAELRRRIPNIVKSEARHLFYVHREQKAVLEDIFVNFRHALGAAYNEDHPTLFEPERQVA